MQDREQIRRFTQGAAMMKDPPMLPIALWMATVPAIAQLGLVTPLGMLISFSLATVATLLGSQWFKRAYGNVTPSADSPGRVSEGATVALFVAVFALEALSDVKRLPVRLGLVVFGVWLIWGARFSRGLRPHLYVPGAICIAVSFLPIVIGYPSNDRSMFGTIFITAFGLGWTYVCIQDYRGLRRVRSVRL
jgi:hypothetical protein